ncbi:MAG: tRNA (N6-isopentenyl adenosine(37)-C2)-methylthiotransferase MiaB, partial [Clostridia bacterium]|nr:tRNA (N6-isopentenyl adenosine(37)-C2)-methylthiotransferase MiaB [Clostridia bacterium]
MILIGKKYYIITYGCQMNLHESEKIAGILESLGATKGQDENSSDIVVFNTCCIRDNAEKKAEGNIGALKSLKRKNKNMILAVCGCMTQQKGRAESLKQKFPFIDIIFGTHNLENFGELIEKRLEKGRKIISVCEENGGINEGTNTSR